MMIERFETKKPIFTKGRILKNEMLAALRDFPRAVTDIFLKPYCDGVIFGFELDANQTQIMIAPGIVKYQGELIVLDAPLAVPYVANNREQFLKLQFEDRYQTADFAGFVVNVILDQQQSQRQNELEIASFKLSQGAYLRLDYQDFEDFKTGHNTLNIVNQPYSSTSGTTLSPIILKYFVNELVRYRTQNAQDLALIYQVLNQNTTVNRELLVYYLENRLATSGAIYQSNEALHAGLVQVLKKVQLAQNEVKQTVSSNRRLLVD